MIMRFTAQHYDQAIAHLTEAKQQLEPDGNCCSVCGDSGHMAFECGFNPLVAISLCRAIADSAEKLHETLHWLAGYEQSFGVQLGPRKVIAPETEQPDDSTCSCRHCEILRIELARLQELNNSLIARVAAQSEVLSRRAEKPQEPKPVAYGGAENPWDAPRS